MKDDVYIANLVSPDELRHSAKGSHWKEHKYLKVVNGIYTYPKRKKEKYLARKEAAENIDEYSRLANEYNAEADKFESEAEELEKQSRDANREQIRNDRLIRETVNKPVPVYTRVGKKEYTEMIPGTQKDDVKEEVYYKSHRGYKDGDIEIKNTLTAGPATHAAQKKRLAQGKRYRAKTSRNKANEYGQKKAQALMTLHDRDIIDKGIDAVAGLFSRKKKKK